ncbi:SRPBCC family protein [Pontibacter akesuensis]|uniref:Polyketide cyclase / dehydrase and lipid transport n=1 Tax=Pontibacter akesuensis TaxID=388950 RepID=A0A1I7G1W5_9BACT|nr:SRPBCC family protein [Pontibacter akesuensis]GHA59273.1 hypothetical protein GCM10007389_09120 [Pontibacter akesuensis]SFU42448.1 Polyketide cyclase / dehydrase and lipid transport [Pontibacter akesuensis]
MRLPKIGLIALLGLSAAAYGAAYLLPTQLEVERSIHLVQEPALVYRYLNNPTEWPNWSAINRKDDPSVIHLYGGPFEGKGARLQWSGDEVGNGHIIFTESTSPSSLVYQQYLPGANDTVQGYFTVQPERDGTLLTWRQNASLAQTFEGKLKGIMLKRRMQQEQEKGLMGLKILLENQSKKKTS